MLGAEQTVALDRLDDELRLAPALGAALFREVIDSASTRFGRSGNREGRFGSIA